MTVHSATNSRVRFIMKVEQNDAWKVRFSLDKRCDEFSSYLPYPDEISFYFHAWCFIGTMWLCRLKTSSINSCQIKKHQHLLRPFLVDRLNAFLHSQASRIRCCNRWNHRIYKTVSVKLAWLEGENVSLIKNWCTAQSLSCLFWKILVRLSFFYAVARTLSILSL